MHIDIESMLIEEPDYCPHYGDLELVYSLLQMPAHVQLKSWWRPPVSVSMSCYMPFDQSWGPGLSFFIPWKSSSRFKIFCLPVQCLWLKPFPWKGFSSWFVMLGTVLASCPMRLRFLNIMLGSCCVGSNQILLRPHLYMVDWREL